MTRADQQRRAQLCPPLYQHVALVCDGQRQRAVRRLWAAFAWQTVRAMAREDHHAAVAATTTEG